MTIEYDHVIVGGGPTGLALATHLPGKVALIERQAVLGGCHRYDPRANPDFAEHGPRVYSGAYVNVARILKTIGLAWDQVFERTSFSPELIDGKKWYHHLSAPEIAWLSWDYTIFALFDARHGQNVTMAEYCESKSFSATSCAYIDAVCRFSDGAGADRYSLWEFLSGFDQHIRPFYIPKKSNDFLFETWHAYLEKHGVDIFVDADVTRVSRTSVTVGDVVVRAKKVILAIPPVHVDALLRASGIIDKSFRDFAKATKYEPYWSISFFGVRVDNAAGHRTTPWGVLAMQMPFGVVSAAATRWDVASPVTGATLARSGVVEAAEEIRRQLGFPPGTKYAFIQSKFHDQAFVAAARKGYVKSALRCGIDTVGCHNGKSNYHFTSMEAAVQNAMAYLDMRPASPWHASDAVRWALVAFVVVIAARRVLKR